MTETAGSMMKILRRHYLPESKPPGGIFAAEIQAPGSTRRADLIWQGVTAGAGYELIGHEVKVSRADVLAELADLTKSDPWMKYCNRWYLVIPTLRLVDGLDLPETWGILTPPSGRRTRSMTVAVKAPKLTPHEQTPALRTIATWLHWRHTAETNRRISAQNENARLDRVVDELRLRVAPADGSRSLLHQVTEEIVRKVGVGYGGSLGDGWKTVLNVDDVVAELNELGTARARAEDLRRQIRYDLESVQRIRKGCDTLLAAAKPEAPGG